MLAYCTYCSAKKHYSKMPLPAIKLYDSERINKIADLAQKQNSKFLILSGKYGLLESDEKIPFYDHLLIDSEVEHHANLVASHLREKNITQIIFYMGNIEQDENIKPYRDCLQKACAECGITIEIIASNFVD